MATKLKCVIENKNDPSDKIDIVHVSMEFDLEFVDIEEPWTKEDLREVGQSIINSIIKMASEDYDEAKAVRFVVNTELSK